MRNWILNSIKATVWEMCHVMKMVMLNKTLYQYFAHTSLLDKLSIQAKNNSNSSETKISKSNLLS